MGARVGGGGVAQRIYPLVERVSTLKEPPRSGPLHAFSVSTAFNFCVTLVIVMKSVTASMAVNAEIRNADVQW